VIDSEQVPWGKGEKQAGEADEIEPETIRLQGPRARKGDRVPIEEWANDFRCAAWLIRDERGSHRETECE